MLWKKIAMMSAINPEIVLVHLSIEDLGVLRRTMDAIDEMIDPGTEIMIDMTEDPETMMDNVGELLEERELIPIDRKCPFERRCLGMDMRRIGPPL
jgi:hypothetical protein